MVEVKHIKLDNGEVIAYRECGRGQKVVILIHGNMCSSQHFTPLLEKMDRDLYKIYALDLRGFGDSTYNLPIQSIHDFSNDVYDIIIKLELTRVILVGWSAGGPICLQLCIDHPEIVSEVLLLNAVGYKGDPLLKKDSKSNLIGGFYKNRDEIAHDPEVAFPLEAIESNNFQVISDMWDRGIYTNKKPSIEENRKLIHSTLKQRNLVDVYWALANFNLSEEHNGYIKGNGLIKNIKVPVLSFWGEKDVIISRKEAEETVEALPNARLRILSECGHSPLIDRIDEVIQGVSSIN